MLGNFQLNMSEMQRGVKTEEQISQNVLKTIILSQLRTGKSEMYCYCISRKIMIKFHLIIVGIKNNLSAVFK